MHELSLAEETVRIVEDAARRDGFARVRTVFVEIGRDSCVMPEALAFCFESAAKGGVAEGARLEIARPPGDGMRVTELDVVDAEAA